MSMTSKIKIYQNDSNDVLYEYEITQAEEAYQMAANLEQMGLDIYVDTPNVTQTLCDTLGLTIEQKEDYAQSVVAEIEDHDGSCCHTNEKA